MSTIFPKAAQSGTLLPASSPHSSSVSNSHASHATQKRLSISSLCSDLSEPSRDVIINEQWLVLGKIGQGSFGEVFEVRDIHTGEALAVKRELQSMRHPQLEKESHHYAILEGGVGIPKCHWYGEHDGFNCMVMDLLGPSLKDLRQGVKDIELDVIVDLGCQMVDILRHVHEHGLVFRDMKPDNFLFAASCQLPQIEMVRVDADMPHYQYITPTCRSAFDQWKQQYPKLHIVDFGLTTHWRDPETGKPYPEGKRRIKNKIGTARYASLNVHHGRLHTRRDDLEGLGYMVLDMMLGSLPWSGIHARNSKAGWDKMRTLKRDTFMSDLCAGHPVGVVEFVEYTKRLKFAEDPDYEYMKRLLRGSLPGGQYSEPARSPFGGGTTSQDSVDIDDKTTEGALAAAAVVGTDAADYQGSESSSESAKAKWKELSKEKKVGWNTYKHDLEPWNPAIDWDTKSGKQSALTASWGEDQPNVAWGSTAKDASGWGTSEPSGSTGGWGTPPLMQKQQHETADQSWARSDPNSDGWGTSNNNSGWPAKESVDTSSTWQNQLKRAQHKHDDSNEVASSQWQIAGRQCETGGSWRANRRPQPQVRGDNRQQHRHKPPPHGIATTTSSHPIQEQHTWIGNDIDSGWTSNTGGDGWVLKDSGHPRRENTRGRGRRRRP